MRPEPQPRCDRLGEQLLAGGQRIGDRLLAPDMLARCNRLPIQVLVLLHVGQIDEQVERYAGQHLLDVRIVLADVEFLGRQAGSFRDSVAGAGQFHERARREMREVHA